jgi:hypothetical protein
MGNSTGELSLFCPMDSLFGQKESLFSQKQGSGRKVLNLRRERLPKPHQEAGIARNFKNSLLSSLFSVRHRVLPDLQGMKAGKTAPSNGMR